MRNFKSLSTFSLFLIGCISFTANAHKHGCDREKRTDEDDESTSESTERAPNVSNGTIIRTPRKVGYIYVKMSPPFPEKIKSTKAPTLPLLTQTNVVP